MLRKQSIAKLNFCNATDRCQFIKFEFFQIKLKLSMAVFYELTSLV